ncbi:Alpha/Beta hydrolase protein [Aspergillus heterothallicus]
MLLPLLLLPLVGAASTGGSAINWNNCTVDNFPALSTLPSVGPFLDDFGTTPHLDCGEVRVPLDWNKPRGKQITIGMARYRAAKPGKRLGSVIYNPGGPGGPGSISVLGEAVGAASSFTNGTLDYYDVIGLDPRGIGLSTKVKCDPAAYNTLATIFPKTEEEFEALVERNRALGESCRDKTGELFYHLDTTQAAKDLEAVRVALREDKLNWIGLSYGTQLGAAYAELFPQRVGRMVLDGNLDHAQGETDALHTEVATYEDVLNQFFKWCDATTTTSDECPLQGQNVAKLFDSLVAAADDSPLDAPGCTSGNTTVCISPVRAEDILINAQGYLIYESTWPTLAQTLNDSLAGDATGFAYSRLAASDDSPYYPDIAIGCLDWLHSSTTLSDLLYKSTLARYIAPHTRGASQSYRYQAACIGWPAPVSNPPHRLNASAMAKAPPMLLVNAIHDPSTSFVWANAMRDQIPSGVLLTRNGNGHTSYGLGGEAAARIDAFLVNGTLPSENTVVYS